MNIIDTEAYRVAFVQYRRKGTPIHSRSNRPG
jgi:hypothetical protein